MEIKMLDEFEVARTQGAEVDHSTNALKVKCCACGKHGTCAGNITVKRWMKLKGWVFARDNGGWTCPHCIGKSNEGVNI